MGTLERELCRPVKSVMNLSFLYVGTLEREFYQPVMNLSFLYVNHIFEVRWVDVGKLCEWWWAETQISQHESDVSVLHLHSLCRRHMYA